MSETESACPGCGVLLPEANGSLERRVNASPACWELYAKVIGHESEHLVQLGALHQLTVDAYGAQHAGEGTPAIALPFGLIGLQLALEEGWTGPQVRAAHQELAQRRRAWPSFRRPADPAWLTIADVAKATNPQEHAGRVRGWASSVWEAWRPEHANVRRWAAEVLPAPIRGRLLR